MNASPNLPTCGYGQLLVSQTIGFGTISLDSLEVPPSFVVAVVAVRRGEARAAKTRRGFPSSLAT